MTLVILLFLIFLWERTMSRFDEIEALQVALNAATNLIAERIQRLIDRIGQSGLSEAEAAEVVADLTELQGRLVALGQDPENPIPEA